jgi:hypothetical protein
MQGGQGLRRGIAGKPGLKGKGPFNGRPPGGQDRSLPFPGKELRGRA